MTEEQKEKNKKTNTKTLKIFMWLFLGFVALVIVGSVIQAIFETPEQKAASIKRQAELDSIQVANEKNKAQEDDLIMALVKSERILKENLKDPDSYDKISDKKFIVTDDKKIYIQVLIKYRAKNSFGAMNIGEQAFNFDKSLNMIESYEVK